MKKILSVFTVLVIVFASFAVSVTAFAQEQMNSANRVYFFNIGGNGAASGDMILIESQDHWGLIDTGHRYGDTIEDENGTVYDAPMSRSLSSQVRYKNGRDMAQYMIDSLGVKHLDFIVATHSHSDHIGGVPEIAELTYEDEEGNLSHLVDSNTVYFYKNYHRVNSTNDDIGSSYVNSWHNQAYFYQAVKSMQEQNCVLAELSKNTYFATGTQNVNRYDDVIDSVNSVTGLSGARYVYGNINDYYDDYLMFSMGDFSLRLYNLYAHSTTRDENINSIIVTVTDGVNKMVSLADINVEDRAEQKLATAIADDIGTVDLLKVAHHGTVSGSNSREMLDLLKPKYAVATRNRDYTEGTNGRGAYSAAVYYAKTNYSTVFYEAGASDFAAVCEFGENDLSFYNLVGNGASAHFESGSKLISHLIPVNGWSGWDVEWNNSGDIKEYYYFQNGVTIPNWREENGCWFYLDTNSVVQTGWLTLGNKVYYLTPETDIRYPTGAMQTGWQKINSHYYYFDEDGVMATGWAKNGSNWYYFNTNGSYLTGWQKISGIWYYFNDSGVMQRGWMKSSGKWYYFASDGAMKTGWNKISGDWYYFDPSGAMLSGWQKISGVWYYLNGGVMQTGWLKQNNKWYYFNTDGAMKTGWLKSEGKWYYFKASGEMATGSLKISGKTYTFSASGAMK